MDQSIYDISWDFDTALRAGRSPRIEDYLGRCAAADRRELWVLLAACEISLTPWDVARVRERIDALRLQGMDAGQLASVLHSVYENRIADGDGISLADFGSFGLSVADMQLRVEDEPYGLGDKVAGRYQLQRRVGAGSFGVVFQAVDDASGRTVAVKTPRTQELGATLMPYFRREMEVANTVGHPGIVHIDEFLTDDSGLPVLIMPFVDGRSLRELMGKPTNPRRAAEIALGILEALRALHAKGITVRDVAPGNVLVSAAGDVYLVDLALAMYRHEVSEREGEFAGTAAFSPPESLLGKASDMDGRTDVFAVGALLYQMLSGLPAVSGSSRGECMADIMMPPGDRPFPDAVPRRLQDICRTSLERQADLRFRSADEFAAAIRGFLNGTTQSPGGTVAENGAWQAWRLGWLMGTVGRQIQDSIGATALVGHRSQAPDFETTGKALLEDACRPEMRAEISLMTLYEVARRWKFRFPGQYSVPGLIQSGIWHTMLASEPVERCREYLAGCTMETCSRLGEAGEAIQAKLQSRAQSELYLFRLSSLCALRLDRWEPGKFADLAKDARLPERLYAPAMATLADASQQVCTQAIWDFRHAVEEYLRGEAVTPDSGK